MQIQQYAHKIKTSAGAQHQQSHHIIKRFAHLPNQSLLMSPPPQLTRRKSRQSKRYICVYLITDAKRKHCGALWPQNWYKKKITLKKKLY